MATIKNLLIRIGVSDKNVATGVAKVNVQLDRLASRVDRIQALGRVGAFGALAGSALQLGRAFAPATAALGHFAVAAAPAAGAVLALPAAILAVVSVVGVLKVGLLGMGDAMKAVASGDTKKLDAALKKLPPSAQAFVRMMGRVNASFDPIRRAVQQKLFAGLDRDIAQAASRNLPALRVGMVGVAGALNGLGREGAQAANTPLFSGMIVRVLALAAGVIRGLTPAIRPLITGVARLVVIGLPLAKIVGDWVTGFVRAGAAWLNSAAAAEKMQRTVDRAAGVLKRNGSASDEAHRAAVALRAAWTGLSAIGRNVWSILQAVGRAMQNSTAPSKSLLQLVTDLTARMAAWANSAQGQQQLSQLFSSLQQLASNLIQVLPQLGGVLTLILQLINGLPAPVRNTVLQMLAWSIVLSRLTGPISGAIGLIGGLGKTAGAFNKVGMGIGKAGVAMGKASVVIGGVAGRIGGAASAALLSLGRLAAASAVTVARVVGGWILMGVQSLIQAARMAAAWFIALGPIGWITAGIIAIVALIIANWDTVKRVTVAVWNAVWGFIKTVVGAVVGFISDHWRLIVAIIGGPLGLVVALVTKYWKQIWSFIQGAVRGVLTAIGWLAQIPGKVGGWFASMAKGAISGASSMLKWIGGIPGAIGRYFSGAGKWLYNAGKNIIYGLWNGVLSVWNWLVKQFNRLTNLIPSWKGPPERDRKLLMPAGVSMMQGLGAAINSQLPALKRTLAGVTGTLGGGVSPLALAGVMPARSGGAAPAGAAGGIDAKVLAAAVAQALNGTAVHMDGDQVGQLVSKREGRRTDQRRRTG